MSRGAGPVASQGEPGPSECLRQQARQLPAGSEAGCPRSAYSLPTPTCWPPPMEKALPAQPESPSARRVGQAPEAPRVWTVCGSSAPRFVQGQGGYRGQEGLGVLSHHPQSRRWRTSGHGGGEGRAPRAGPGLTSHPRRDRMGWGPGPGAVGASWGWVTPRSQCSVLYPQPTGQQRPGLSHSLGEPRAPWRL